MNNLEDSKKFEETNASCNGSRITKPTEPVDVNNFLQLPLKKRCNRTLPTVQLSTPNLLTTDRVTRISSGTIKPRSFSNLHRLSMKTDSKVAKGKGDASNSTPKQGKHLKSEEKCAQKVKNQRLENRRTTSGNSLTLPNLDAMLRDAGSESTKAIMPSLLSVATKVEHSGTWFDSRNADETGKLAAAEQHKGRKRKHDLLLNFNDFGEQHHHVLNTHQIGCDSKQSLDTIANAVVSDFQLNSQNFNVCDEFSCGVESALASNTPKCSELIKLTTKLESRYLDTAFSPYISSAMENASTKVKDEYDMNKALSHTDGGMCVGFVNEQCKSEGPILSFVQQCSDSAEGSQVFDTFNPETMQPSEGKRNRRQGKRKQLHFRCSTCKLRFFETKEELDVHVECHVGKPGDPEFYRCRICPYTSTFWNRILSHLIIHDEYKKRLTETKLVVNILGKFPCPECGQSFERKVNMQGHLKMVHFKENHTCDQCGLTLSRVDKKTFMRHQEKCRNVKITCTFCDYATTVTSNMQKHMKVHNGEGFVCSNCSAVFPTRQRYQVHMLTHRTDRPRYGCEYCGMMFVSEDSVKKHCVRLHQNVERSIACPHCPYVARMKVDLKKHIHAVHEKKHRCLNCPYSTNSDHAFEQHKTYHMADHVFACSVAGCFYRGTCAKQVAVHNANVHHLDSKHQCPVCKKYYKKKTHLLRHLVSHTGDRAYSCLECGQTFFSHSSYYRHRRRMQHDENRESVASVPQNITIQYLDEAAEEPAENSSPAGVIDGGKPVDEAMSNVQVLYEQILEQSGEPLLGGSSSDKIELTSLLTESNQGLMLEEAKSESSAITYLVEVKRDANVSSNQAYYAISEQCNNGLEQGYYISNVVDNSLDNVSPLLEVPPFADKDPSKTPQYTLVVLPKDGAS